MWYIEKKPHIGPDGRPECSLAQRSLQKGLSKTHDWEQSQVHERCAALTEQTANLCEFPAVVENHPVHLLLDSGASTEFINKLMTKKIQFELVLSPSVSVRLVDGNITISILFADAPLSAIG